MRTLTQSRIQKIRTIAAHVESELERRQREADLVTVAARLKLVRQERNQPGAPGIPEQIRFRCVNRLSPCHGTDICIPVDEATAASLEDAYIDTLQRFVDAHPFETASETRE